MLRFLGTANGKLATATGTIACGNARQVNMQVTLDSNSGYEIAVLPITSASGTTSKITCAAVLSNLGTYEAVKPAGSGNWWLAWASYNGATATAGTTNDRYVVEKLG